MKLNPKKFVAQVDAAFVHSLSSFGFEPAGEDHEDDWHASRTYRAGDRYIEINANCHFRDGQPECRVVLGDGPNDWPERDWNAIALWRLSNTGDNYPIQKIEDVPSILKTMANDLLEQADDFLSGNIDRFLKQRAAQNREREPYMIQSPQPDGSYQTTYEPESLQLKERYSQEKRHNQ